MNSTFLFLNATCCPALKKAANEIASNGSDVLIVLIICLTVWGSLLTICIKMFDYLKERNSSEIDKKTRDELNQQIEGLKKERDKIQKEKSDAEKKLQLTQEQKETNRFLDFCYDMANSTEKDNAGMKKECWEILKKRQNISESPKE